MNKGLLFKGIFVWMVCSAAVFEGFAYGQTPVAEKFRSEVKQLVAGAEIEGPKAIDLVRSLKAAGASYLPEILASSKFEKYRTESKQRLMAGIYLMDLYYAIVFGKDKDAAQYGTAVYTLEDKLGFPVPGMEKRFREALSHMDDADSGQRIDTLAKELDADLSWQEMLSTPDGMKLVIEGHYGWMLEGVYIASELAAQSNYNPAFIKALDDHRAYFGTFVALLDKLVDKPEIASVLRKDNCIETAKTISALLSSPNPMGKKEVEEIRKVAGEARNRIVD